MTIVVDSSVAVSWCIPDEISPISDMVLGQVERQGMLVPSLFWYEVRNVFIVNERRGRITENIVHGSLKRLSAFPIIYATEHDETMLLQLSRKHRLSVYDAAYLEIAIQNEAPLASLDKALLAAAKVENLEYFA